MNDTQMNEILERLITARKAAGLSQSQVSQMLGLSGSAATVSQWEHGGRGLDVSRFLDLCALYGVSPVWALTGTNPDFEPTRALLLAQHVEQAVIDLLEMITGKEARKA